MSKSLERRLDELQLAVMAALEKDGFVIALDEGEGFVIYDDGQMPYRLTLGQMAYGSDEAADRAFHRIITAYDGGNQ